MQPSFLRLRFSSFLVFSELHDFNRSLGFNARAVARKQRQVLQKLKKSIYFFTSQTEICHATEFSEVAIFKFSSVLGIA